MVAKVEAIVDGQLARAGLGSDAHAVIRTELRRVGREIAYAALRARPALSDEVVREMARPVIYRLQYAHASDYLIDELCKFARAVLARQQEP